MSASLAPKISFVSQRFTDDRLDYTDLSGLLSPFQIEKFSYFYKFFDSNGDGHVDMDDMEGINERLRNVAGWSKDDPQYLSLMDNNRVFMECLLDQVKKEKDTEGLEHRTWAEAMAPSRMNVTHCSQSAWLHMWARLCKGSAGIDDFPIWVQLLPRALFNIIVAREGASVISKSSLRNFYERFTGLSGQVLEKVTENGYNIASAVFIFVAFREEMIFCCRVEIMSSILRATNYFSPTFCWVRPSMDLVRRAHKCWGN